MTAWADFQSSLTPLASQWPQRVGELVDRILEEAVRVGASDVHFEPAHSSLLIRMRIDGVLQPVASLPRELAGNCIARLKVMAELLTYRLDVPQEGRVTSQVPCRPEMRVSTFPTIHGERAVVRLFDPTGRIRELDELGFSISILRRLRELLADTSGVILLTGPSGSGKTTTIYACLLHLVQANRGGRHIVTLEDPVEVALEGVSQSQVHPASGFDFARGLRSLLRQDPEVIMIGEIRDRETAEIAVEAGLTGHLVISTLHCGSACGVVGRLMEMGIEPHLLTSSLKAVVNQRLVRRLCSDCARPVPPPEDQRLTKTTSSELVEEASSPEELEAGNLFAPLWESAGCPICFETGYRGRRLLAELLVVDEMVRHSILQRCDTRELERRVQEQGHETLWAAARQALEMGEVSLAEIRRVLGREDPGA